MVKILYTHAEKEHATFTRRIFEENLMTEKVHNIITLFFYDFLF